MFAAPARVGNICGWSPTDNRHDTLYTTIPTQTRPSSALHLVGSSTPSAPRATRNSLPRSQSLDSHVDSRATLNPKINNPSKATTNDTKNDDYDFVSISPYHNPTSLRRYKAKRSKDPKWAPRPPNAFILFRRHYVNEHKGEADNSNEKTTLSHRAGVAWKSLSSEEQKEWFEAAKAEAAEHLKRNPDYAFRPNKKTRSEARRHPALPSRREQVEEYARKATHRAQISRVRTRRQAQDEEAAAADAEGCATPGSVYSTSPEPPGTPSSQTSSSSQGDLTIAFVAGAAAAGAIPRSHSHVVLPITIPHPVRPANTHAFLTPGASSSMPDLNEAAAMAYGLPMKRSFSYTDGSAPWEGPYDEFGESDAQSTRSFDSLSSPASAYPWGGASPEQLSPSEFGVSLQMPEPVLMPSADLQAAQQASYFPSSGHLMERRRRSATTSNIPSPLSVVTSSLSGWARDDLATARMAPPREPQPQSARPPVPQVHVETVSPSQVEAWYASPVTDVDMHALAVGGGLGLADAAVAEIEYDRTPRASLFPQHAAHPHTHALAHPHASHYPAPATALAVPQLQYPGGAQDMLGAYELADLADLESYNMGLQHAGIGGAPGGAHEGFGSPGAYVDYNALYPAAVSVEQN